ncbi:MAG: hypothetical protein DWP97_03295 [Calditrichaeota bacterium]|nr:MAG: hypothetical protein DWP97_03295 [Calditrichota bacterium]
MKHFLTYLTVFGLLFALVGCSDDDEDGPTGGGTPTGTATSTWNATGGYWSSNIDGTDSDNFTYFSFDTKDTTTTGVPKLVVNNSAATAWDIAFRREEIKTNGGSSTNNSGDVEVADLGVVDYSGVTIADTLGATWVSDYIDYFIDEWYNYNPQTHQLTANQFVYSMVDASGDHYIKFQVDSMVGGGMPPDMGTVYIKYFYQSTANSLVLDGSAVETSIAVGANPAYFDFSSGTTVTPADPTNSLDWDIMFYSYEIGQNSGPNGSGDCAAFPAFTELADSTDFAGFTAQPTGAPLFPDIAGSALTEWYTYTGPPLHQLFSNSNVYLLRTGGIVYKMRIESYYGENGDKASANYHYIWQQL